MLLSIFFLLRSAVYGVGGGGGRWTRRPQPPNCVPLSDKTAAQFAALDQANLVPVTAIMPLQQATVALDDATSELVRVVLPPDEPLLIRLRIQIKTQVKTKTLLLTVLLFSLPTRPFTEHDADNVYFDWTPSQVGFYCFF